MEEFSVRAAGLTSKRVGRVLQARGINGIVVAPLPEGTHQLDLSWDPFSAVAIGLSLWAPRQHAIVHHHLASMATCLQTIRGRGYRRIALVLEPNHDLRVQHHWSAAFLAEQRRAGLSGDLIFDQLDAPSAFVTWFRRHRPDVILGDNLVAARMLDAAGYRIPRDCAFVVLNLAGHERGFAGINQLSEAIGMSAVSRLVGSLRQNEFGVPELPEVTLVPGEWVDGPSLPQKGAGKERMVPPPLDPGMKRLR
jgi:LacI family transcriptional regulator